MLCSIYPTLPILSLNSTTLFNLPQVTPFLRFSLIVDRPVNTTTTSTLGVTTQTCGGSVAGIIEGTVLPLGVSFETMFPDTNGSITV